MKKTYAGLECEKTNEVEQMKVSLAVIWFGKHICLQLYECITTS